MFNLTRTACRIWSRSPFIHPDRLLATRLCDRTPRYVQGRCQR
jgi:hypothetical protein